MRSAQKVLPATVFETGPTEIANDVINFSDLSVREGQTKSFVEIFQEFTLTSAQATNEAHATPAGRSPRWRRSRSRWRRTRSFFRAHGKLPGGVHADQVESAGAGLLGEANPNDANDDDPLKVSVPIVVPRVAGKRAGLLFGENVFTAVADGIAKLIAKAQAPKFALFFPVKVFADTFVASSEASLVTTADRIKPLVEGGFQETVSLPQEGACSSPSPATRPGSSSGAKREPSSCARKVRSTFSAWSSASSSSRGIRGRSCCSISSSISASRPMRTAKGCHDTSANLQVGESATTSPGCTRRWPSAAFRSPRRSSSADSRAVTRERDRVPEATETRSDRHG